MRYFVFAIHALLSLFLACSFAVAQSSPLTVKNLTVTGTLNGNPIFSGPSGITRAAIPTTVVPPAISEFNATGSASAGDGGASCPYLRVAAGGGPGAVQDAAGAWFQFPPKVPLRVECFGALGSGDDTARIAAAATSVAALNSGNGGALIFSNPLGYTIASGITVPNGQQWFGNGNTFFNCTASSGACVTLIGDSADLDGIDLYHSGSTGTSVGIQIGSVANGTKPGVHNVKVRGSGGAKWNTAISVLSNVVWRLDDVYVSDFSTYGVRIQNVVNPDSSDGLISGLTVDGGNTSPTACIRYESGGGLKMIGVKTLNCGIGFDQEWTSAGGSQDLAITGSSFENAGTACMRLGRGAGSQTFGNYAITGNEYAGCPTGILVAAGAANGVIDASNFSSISGPAIRIQEGVTNFKVGVNSYSAGINVQDDRTTFNGKINYDQMAYLNLSSSSTYTSYFTLKTSPSRSAMVEIFVEGILQGAGVINRYDKFILTDTAGTVALTSVQSVAPAFALDFNIDLGTASTAIVQYKLHPATGSSFQGTATIKIDGKLAAFTALSN